ncbi:hypothetical protein [Mycobacterium uberis]|uniref:hypothetical protein n=1 Tax=Mycobacterium uberis TaxID=2162698 RepID=UPI000E302B1F|nr:hypothetical protein [Mycobacterium uberis]
MSETALPRWVLELQSMTRSWAMVTSPLLRRGVQLVVVFGERLAQLTVEDVASNPLQCALPI